MPDFGEINVTGPANRDVYFKGIYDAEATRLGADGKSENPITAPLGEHTLVTITDRVAFEIDHEGVGEIQFEGEHIDIELAPISDSI